jgi:hypothetical protein
MEAAMAQQLKPKLTSKGHRNPHDDPVVPPVFDDLEGLDRSNFSDSFALKF